jgi:uncharacterized protein
MSTQVDVFDPGTECRWIATRFHERLSALAPSGAHADADPGIAPDNIVILFPYALLEACPFGGGREAARTMALGNAFGAAHFLLQDRVLDGDEAISPGGCLIADGCLLAFWREYARVLPPGSRFWRRFEGYLAEYFSCLSWERDVLRTEQGAETVADGAIEATLLQLGRRMSPLKATAAAVSELARVPELLDTAERIIEAFHAGYQLLDDLEDLESDLASKRWSAAAWIIAEAGGIDLPSAGMSASELFVHGAKSGALGRISELVTAGFRTATELAEQIGASLLAAHLRNRTERSRGLLDHAASRLSVAAHAAGECVHVSDRTPVIPTDAAARLHAFSVDGSRYVYDRDSGLFFEADAEAVDLIAWLRRGADPADLDVLRMNHGNVSVSESLAELAILSGTSPKAGEGACPSFDDRSEGAGTPSRGEERTATATRPAHSGLAPSQASCPTLGPVVSLALNVSGDCNLACDYCYLGGGSRVDGNLMSERTALLALDLLFAESFGERELSLVFFGGEPLLNLELIESVATCARERARSQGRSLRLHMTTNGTLLTTDVYDVLRRAGVSVLVSIDGGRSSHDAHRAFPDGCGSYDLISANVRAIASASGGPGAAFNGPPDARAGECSGAPTGPRLAARATITPESGPLPDVVSELRSLGFSTIHLSPVSGVPVSRDFAQRLVEELDLLAISELEAVRGGRPPTLGNLLEPLALLELGSRRLTPCGAGTKYISVSHTGELFLCHRFAGDTEYRVGDVVTGLDRHAVARLLAALHRPTRCECCWALGLCGGPCFHDQSAERTSTRRPGHAPPEPDHRCDVTRRVLELSMWLYASLPEELREDIARRARSALPQHAGRL